MSKQDLKNKARKLIEFVHSGHWEILENLLDSDFPHELADLMLEGVQFNNDSSDGRINLRDAPWMWKAAIRNTRSSSWSGADEERAALLAVNLVNKTTSNSKYRRAAFRKKRFAVAGVAQHGEMGFQPETQNEIIKKLLRIAIKTFQNLEELNLSSLPSDFLFDLNDMEHLTTISVGDCDSIQIARLGCPSRLKKLKLKANHVHIDQAYSETLKHREISLTIEPSCLESIDPQVAHFLVAGGGDLRLESIKSMDHLTANVLARCLGNITTPKAIIDPLCMKELARHKSFSKNTNQEPTWFIPHPDESTVWHWAVPERQLDNCSDSSCESISYNRIKPIAIYGEVLIDFGSGNLIASSKLGKAITYGQDRYYAIRSGKIECYTLDGNRILWSIAREDVNKLIGITDAVLAISDLGLITKYDSNSGAKTRELKTNISDSMGSFKLDHLFQGDNLLLWNSKTKYGGSKVLISVSTKSLELNWEVCFDGIIGWRIVCDCDKNLVLCAGSKLHKLDPLTGKKIGSPKSVGGAWAEPLRCYEDGGVIVGCQKGYETPVMKLLDANGRAKWSVEHREGSRNATTIENYIILVDQNTPRRILMIDRFTGGVSVTEQPASMVNTYGFWDSIYVFDERYLIIKTSRGILCYDGIPSSWSSAINRIDGAAEVLVKPRKRPKASASSPAAIDAKIMKVLKASPLGLLQREICEATGVSYASVLNWLQENRSKVRTEGERKARRVFLV